MDVFTYGEKYADIVELSATSCLVLGDCKNREMRL